jgi:hypothetical protein
MARETTTWQERRQHGNSNVIGQYGKNFLKILYFSTVWPILSITSQIERRNFYNMWKERRKRGKRNFNVEIETLSSNMEKKIKISSIF